MEILAVIMSLVLSLSFALAASTALLGALVRVMTLSLSAVRGSGT